MVRNFVVVMLMVTVGDVRSVSRVGRSDVGTNAQRIREYLERLSK